MKKSHLNSNAGDILIVDDDISSLQVLSDILTAHDFDVRGAKNGIAALKYIETDTPELVLLDVRMPDMDGFEVCRRLKGDPRYEDLPVIFLSALKETDHRIHGFEVGGVDYIIKPFQAEEVVARVKTHVSLRSMSKNLETEVTKRTAALKESEKALIEQLRFEDLLSKLSATFIDIKASEIDGNIERGLRLVSEYLDVQRCNLFQFSEDQQTLMLTHFFTSKDVDPTPQMIYASQQPWFTEKLLRNEPICLSDPDELPDEAGAEKVYLRQQGIRSVLVLPLLLAGVVHGGITLASMEKRREWPETIVRQINTLVEVFANALARKRADEKIGSALEEIRQLKEQLERENVYLKEEVAVHLRQNNIIGKSGPIIKMLGKAERVAQMPTGVLIYGETGAGKNLLARVIHQMSSRNKKTMVSVNCTALPATLFESELFGREKGAYTGSIAKSIGRFELADQSTLFLDEIGGMPLEVQSKLLRVMESGEFERLGSNQTLNCDVRIIAATNRNLAKMTSTGEFRKDLYYRLNVFPIEVPPLRDRREDIPLLVWAFVKEFAKSMNKTISHISEKSMNLMIDYPWPGNIRELRNVLERAIILTTGSTLWIDKLDPLKEESPVPLDIQTVEKRHIIKVLKMTDWRVRGNRGASEILNLKPSTLESRMKKLGIQRPF